jgi:predicted O-methyltransferase YrrM
MTQSSRSLRDRLKDFVRHRPELYFLYHFHRVIKRQQLVFVDYPVNPSARYGYGKPPHRKLNDLIAKDRDGYKVALTKFWDFKDSLLKIPAQSADPVEPTWVNKWLSPLDMAALYCLIALNHPRQYFEVGSGVSTCVARRAVRDHVLRTRITSIDPQPRAEIDSICDEIIRQPLEKTDLAVFERLAPGDILFIDSSHRVFTNSDVTVAFLEVLPRLQPGVLVHLHDIFLPWDYPPEWRDRYYSEQYMLAAMLLGQTQRFHVALPNFFIGKDPELKAVLAPLWNDPQFARSDPAAGPTDMADRTGMGSSFWMRTT